MAAGGEQADAIEADRPWTVVSTAKNRRGRRRRPVAAVSGVLDFDAAVPAAAAAKPGPHSPSPISSIKHIQADHARITAWWHAQPSFRQLLDLVTSRLASRVGVTQAVCLGAGSFGAPLDTGEHIRRAHIQTDAFLAIVDALCRHSNCTIPCYFQEPLYTAADKAYIRQLGHHVLEPPAAAQMITAATLVFAIHLPTPEYLRCLEPVEPAILVGTGYDRYENLPLSPGLKPQVVLKKLYNIHTVYQRLDFPQEQHDYCFSDTVIYWRPQN